MTIIEPISKVIIQTPDVFRNTVKYCREVCQDPHYHVEDGVSAISDIYTKCGNTCSELGMSNGKQVYIGHFAPEYRKDDSLNKLDYIIKNFQDATGKLSAFLTGAYDYAFIGQSINAKASYDFNVDIAALLDKNNVPLTMISGKTNPVFTDSLAVTKDAFILSHTKKVGISTFVPKFPKNPSDSQVLKVLKENYKVVEPDDSHKIFFEG